MAICNSTIQNGRRFAGKIHTLNTNSQSCRPHVGFERFFFPQIVVWWLNLEDQSKVLLTVTAIEYLTYLKEVKKVAFWEVSSRGREERKEKWKKGILTRFVFSSLVSVTLWKLSWQATRLCLHRCYFYVYQLWSTFSCTGATMATRQQF